MRPTPDPRMMPAVAHGASSTLRRRRFPVNTVEYPFTEHWLERSGAAMHYVDEGAGLGVLMLHGNPTWSYVYRNVIKDLRGTCRTIAPDYYYSCSSSVGWGWSSPAQILAQIPLFRHCVSCV
jgi:hypothetical protein